MQMMRRRGPGRKCTTTAVHTAVSGWGWGGGACGRVVPGTGAGPRLPIDCTTQWRWANIQHATCWHVDVFALQVQEYTMVPDTAVCKYQVLRCWVARTCGTDTICNTIILVYTTAVVLKVIVIVPLACCFKNWLSRHDMHGQGLSVKSYRSYCIILYHTVSYCIIRSTYEGHG